MFKLPDKGQTDEGSSAASHHLKARGTAERLCRSTCPGEKHSTAHHVVIIPEHSQRLLSDELPALYHYKHTMSIGN